MTWQKYSKRKIYRQQRLAINIFKILLFSPFVCCTSYGYDDTSQLSVLENRIGIHFDLMKRFDSGELQIDFDSDGRPDSLAIIREISANPPTFLTPNAFSYGINNSSGSRCLLVALANLQQWQERNSVQIMCGRSPLLILSQEQPLKQVDVFIKKISIRDASAYLPMHVVAKMRGDAAVLQTEAAESVLFYSDNGFHWEELPTGQ